MRYDLSSYRKIKVSPVAGALGAEIAGVDASAAIADDVFEEIRRAFLAHHILFFRDQGLSPDALVAFGERFAPLSRSEYLGSIAENPFVHRMVREAEVPSSERNIGDRWHSDLSPRERPTFGFMLYCLEAPDYGGDTMFANLCLAYDTLSDAMKALCEQLVVIHSPSGVFGGDGAGGAGTKKPLVHKGMEKNYAVSERTLADLRRETEHPLVRIHPETGRRILFITGDYCIRLKGMTEAESRPIIDFLNRHAVRPEFTCRFRWRTGSLAVLDNRCTQHYAVNDYAGFRRAMLRIELEGERPFGPAMPRVDRAAE